MASSHPAVMFVRTKSYRFIGHQPKKMCEWEFVTIKKTFVANFIKQAAQQNCHQSHHNEFAAIAIVN